MLERQEFVGADPAAIASALDAFGTLVEFDRNQTLNAQQDANNDIYRLQAGSVSIVANAAEAGTRKRANTWARRP